MKYNYNINKPCYNLDNEADMENFTKQFKVAIEHLLTTEYMGTYFWYLEPSDERNIWAIVLGWKDDDYGMTDLHAKLAYQPTNSLMQCDYDIDWLMPYDEKSMEVYDNEVTIYDVADAEEAIDWLYDCYRFHFAD